MTEKPKARLPLPTAERVRQLLSYDPVTGYFTWLHDSVTKGACGHLADDRAGSLHSQGYLTLHIDGRNHKAHRVAWLYMTGQWPIALVDHRDRQKSRNVWENLRHAWNGPNRANSEVRRDSQSGLKGVHRKGRRWRAVIRVDTVLRHLGYFGTPEDAHAAYAAAAQLHFGEFARAT